MKISMYPPELVDPMRHELTSAGVKELRSAREVDELFEQSTDSILVLVNSVCGCAAGGARPGVKLALQHPRKPSICTTVFAGVDKEATEKARSYFGEHAPSSPSIALLNNGKVVFMLERSGIEGFSPEQIASKLTHAFDTFLV